MTLNYVARTGFWSSRSIFPLPSLHFVRREITLSLLTRQTVSICPSRCLPLGNNNFRDFWTILSFFFFSKSGYSLEITPHSFRSYELSHERSSYLLLQDENGIVQVWQYRDIFMSTTDIRILLWKQLPLTEMHLDHRALSVAGEGGAGGKWIRHQGTEKLKYLGGSERCKEKGTRSGTERNECSPVQKIALLYPLLRCQIWMSQEHQQRLEIDFFLIWSCCCWNY